MLFWNTVKWNDAVLSFRRTVSDLHIPAQTMTKSSLYVWLSNDATWCNQCTSLLKQQQGIILKITIWHICWNYHYFLNVLHETDNPSPPRDPNATGVLSRLLLWRPSPMWLLFRGLMRVVYKQQRDTHITVDTALISLKISQGSNWLPRRRNWPTEQNIRPESGDTILANCAF